MSEYERVEEQHLLLDINSVNTTNCLPRICGTYTSNAMNPDLVGDIAEI